MGQDTYVKAGISVKLPFTFANRKHIYYLLQEFELKPYVCTENDDDEIYSLEYEYNFEKEEDKEDDHIFYDNHYGFSLPSESFLRKVSMIDDQNDYDEILSKSKQYNQLTFIFLYPFLDAYARNISRRNHIFDQIYITPDDLIKTIQNGQSLFLNVGIPPKMIYVGYSFRDSY